MKTKLNNSSSCDNAEVNGYLALPWTYKFEYNAKDKAYIATVSEFPGCVTDGETIEEALAMVKDALRGVIATYLDFGDEFPTPGEWTETEITASQGRFYLNYGGLQGTIEYSEEDECFHGAIQNVKDLILYEGTDIQELRQCFRNAVCQYSAEG